ncbi:thiosulfate sulfurtransferase-like [Octopus sinensis]|uniref:Thiosulfate sulfurtransferase-like n=1 Tax=Octopus sinensis TaxID=2607531 RepID=A0A6P7TXC3_9MOLL|nr:thiosulfate sulfurtransferase-like [Octopus sinensis]
MSATVVNNNQELIESYQYTEENDFLTPTIDGSLSFDIDECCDTTSSYPHMLPPCSQFEEYVSNLGITNSSHVVVYDNWPQIGIFSSPRLWWMFHVFGHKNVSVLDGGLPGWQSEGYDVTYRQNSLNVNSNFRANFNSDLVKNFKQIQCNVKSGLATLVDARSADRFNGLSPEPRAGSSIFIILKFWQYFGKLGLICQLRFGLRVVLVVYMCSSFTGVTASILSFASYICGFDILPVYDGSWTEWSNNLDNS